MAALVRSSMISRVTDSPLEDSMRIAPWLTVLTVALAACSPVRVTTTVAPDANFGGFRTFKVLDVPARRGAARSIANDPMLDNSITNRALRQHLANAFMARNYTVDQVNPDFTVAYYASRRGELDVREYDYGYPGRWGGWRDRGGVEVRPYIEGTVIVDVVNPKTHELVWRGRGVSDVSDDPETYAQNLNRAIGAIVKKFPAP
jgi:hypothetical protein